VRSSSSTTSSPTTYSLIISLPFDNGYEYSCSAYMPFGRTSGSSIDLSGGLLTSFSNNIILFTASNLINNSTITINNLLTHISL